MITSRALAFAAACLMLSCDGCIFRAPLGVNFDVALGALVRCDDGGRINQARVYDPATNEIVFSVPSDVHDTASLVYVVPGSIARPAGVVVADLKPNKEYLIRVYRGDVEVVVRVWTNQAGVVDSMFIDGGPCSDGF